jgi:ABC-type Fe3+/spermidine/putrescine transport system ATPase subunit
VADFVGTNNLVEGTVQAVDGADLVVETALGPWRARAGGPLAAGSRCVVAIRPEHVELTLATGAPDPGVTLVRGRVRLASYLGSTLRYDLLVGPLVLIAEIGDPTRHVPLPAGAPVVLRIPAEVARALPAAEGGGA